MMIHMVNERNRPGPSRGRAAIAVVLVAIVLVGTALVLTNDDGDGSSAGSPTTTDTGLPSSTEPDSTTTTGVPGGTGELGTVQEVGPSASCPMTECTDVQVECPGVPAAPATVAVEPAGGAAEGVVVVLSGALGNTYWASPQQGRQFQVVSDIAARGLEVVQVAWPGQGWGGAPDGEALGFARLACRAATILRWIHDVHYVPLGIDAEQGVCGFCVSGNSGGASEIAYSLAFYGLEDLIDVAVLTSGPPHAGIGLGCLDQSRANEYAFGRASLPYIDTAYGHPDSPGPCAQSDESFSDVWAADSVDTGGTDYDHPNTRIEFLLGGQDRTTAPAHAELYIERLREAGSPMVRVQEIPEMEHEVLAQTVSREALIATLFGDS